MHWCALKSDQEHSPMRSQQQGTAPCSEKGCAVCHKGGVPGVHGTAAAATETHISCCSASKPPKTGWSLKQMPHVSFCPVLSSSNIRDMKSVLQLCCRDSCEESLHCKCMWCCNLDLHRGCQRDCTDCTVTYMSSMKPRMSPHGQ